MEKLLHKYCKLNSIKIEDMKGCSHAKGLPTHRHIFSYCVKVHFPGIKLWQIGTVLNKSQVLYGIRLIGNRIKLFEGKGKIPTEIIVMKNRIDAFRKVCNMYSRVDLKLPTKEIIEES